MRNDKFLNYIHLHFIVFIWGFTAVLGALISVNALPLVWYRMAIATVLIFLYIKVRKINIKFTFKTISGFLLAGILIAMHWLAFFGAIKVSNVSVTLAIMSTGAFFASFLEPIFFKRKVIWYEVFFGILVIAGLYIIFEFESQYLTGILLALASSFLGVLFTLLNGKFIEQYNATAISFYELGFGAICVTIVLFFNGSFTAELFVLKPSDWVYLLILASACTAYAFIASIHVLKWISPYTMMLTVNLEPVYGILLAVAILGDSEKMSPQFYYGAILILSTVIANGIVKISAKRKKEKV